MPRRITVDYPGAFHHVIVRGAGRHDIFRDDSDRAAYCDRLGFVAADTGATCLAWALMPNHVHLVVRTGARPLSRVMHRVGTRYSRYFNDRYGRVGHLLQGRYRAIPVASDAQLATLVRCVHANPLRAGIISSHDELSRHRWTGHAALIGRVPAAPFHDTRAALQLFSECETTARASLLELMGSADEDWNESQEVRRGDVGVVAIPTVATASADRSLGLAALMSRVCRAQRVSESELRAGSRRRPISLARATIAYVAFHEFGLSLAETARLLGVSRQALWSRLEDGRRAAALLPPEQLDAATT